MWSPAARAARAAAVAALGLTALGCAQSAQGPSTPGHAVRSSVETAPADLQLICAAEAARVYSAPDNRVLPLSSSRSGAATYDVELDVAGRRARCTIDESGLSVTVVDA